MYCTSPLFYLLQVPTLNNTDPNSVLAWVASLGVLGIVALGGILIKSHQEHAKQIQSLNDKHAAEKDVLNKELRQILEDSSERFFEHSKTMHAAISEISNLHPETRQLFTDLENSLKKDHEKMIELLTKKS